MADRIGGCLVFGTLAAVVIRWIIVDFNRGETVLVPGVPPATRAAQPIRFWTQLIALGLFALINLYGVALVVQG